MAKIDRPIVVIREIFKKIKFEPQKDHIPKKALKRFVHFIEEVNDPRREGMLSYPLEYILICTFLAVLVGADTWTEISGFAKQGKHNIKRILGYYKGAPSHDTFRRVMGLINPEELQEAITSFLLEKLNVIKQSLNAEDGIRLITVDGKEAKQTGRKYNTNEKIRNLQTLNVYDASNAVCLASVSINEKTNEIPTAQEILKTMQLKNCVVTFDSMNTQKETIRIITENSGDYVGGLKGNHEVFFNEVALYFSKETLAHIRKSKKNFYTYSEKAHNRIEKRTYYLTADVKWFKDIDKWSKLKAFICYDIETEDIVTGKKTSERRYYITSITDIELVADAIRGHWGVENELHWHLDVTFAEDENTTMDKNAFNNLSIVNKMVLSFVKLMQPTIKLGLKSIRKLFGWNLIEHLSLLLSLFDEDFIKEAMLSTNIKTK